MDSSNVYSDDDYFLAISIFSEYSYLISFSSLFTCRPTYVIMVFIPSGRFLNYNSSVSFGKQPGSVVMHLKWLVNIKTQLY
jgi:hypothetical protein